MVFSAWHHATTPVARLKIHARHGELPRVEKGFATLKNCHAWLSQPLPHVTNIKSNAVQSLVMRKHTILTVLKLIYAVLLATILVLQVWPIHLTNCASYALALSSCKFQLLPSSASIYCNIQYYNNDFARHFFMIVSK